MVHSAPKLWFVNAVKLWSTTKSGATCHNISMNVVYLDQQTGASHNVQNHLYQHCHIYFGQKKAKYANRGKINVLSHVLIKRISLDGCSNPLKPVLTTHLPVCVSVSKRCHQSHMSVHSDDCSTVQKNKSVLAKRPWFHDPQFLFFLKFENLIVVRLQ